MVLRNVSEVVDALGGTSAVAKLCGALPSAVSNWRDQGFPDRATLHETLAKELIARDLDWDPAIVRVVKAA